MAYTFKDDGHALTYYREYNKEVGTGDKTLVGNWVEERALRSDVETGRYKLWANPSADPLAPQETFTKQTSRPDNSDTFRRTIAHGDHEPAGSYMTSNQVPDPGYRIHTRPEMGARERLLEERALALALEEEASQQLPLPSLDTTSTHRSDFVEKEIPPNEMRGKRVMEGKPDLTFRKELGLVAPHMLEDPTEPGSLLPSASATFGKNNEFSLPIHYAKSGIEKNC